MTIEDLVESWNEVLPPLGLSAVRLPLATSRRRKVIARLAEHPDLEFWQGVFDALSRSRFLRGENQARWRASFDWVMANDLNATKVIEGQYRG